MAKRSLEEMLNDNQERSSGSQSDKGVKKRRSFTPKEKRKLAVYWTILILCLAGFIIMLIFLIGNNPLERTTAPTSSPNYSYSQLYTSYDSYSQVQ